MPIPPAPCSSKRSNQIKYFPKNARRESKAEIC
jgi:hypothetical protein